MRTIGIARSGDGAEVAAADVVLGELSADAVLGVAPTTSAATGAGDAVNALASNAVVA